MPAPVHAATRLQIAGTHNFREVALGSLAPGRLYRSDALHRLTREGRGRLAALDVKLVIDLRTDFDRRFGGRDKLRGTGARYLALPIEGTAKGTAPEEFNLRTLYRSMLDEHVQQFGAVLHAVAEADGPVVVHCTAGKDRTGLVSVLALAALGVETETIVADYVLSEHNLSGPWAQRMLHKVRRHRVPITDGLREVLTASPEPVLLETLDWLEAQHGGLPGYLAAAGINDRTTARLRETLALPRDYRAV